MIIVLAQMLTMETSVLLRRIQPLRGGHTSFHVRHSLSFSQKVLNMALLSKEEVMKSITDSVVRSIVSQVVSEHERRNEVVEKAVSEMIDVFIDSKQEHKERSLQDKLFVEGVVGEIVDGIVGVLAQPPSELLLLFSEKEEDDEAVSEAVGVCELAVRAIGRVIRVGVSEACKA